MFIPRHFIFAVIAIINRVFSSITSFILRKLYFYTLIFFHTSLLYFLIACSRLSVEFLGFSRYTNLSAEIFLIIYIYLLYFCLGDLTNISYKMLTNIKVIIFVLFQSLVGMLLVFLHYI